MFLAEVTNGEICTLNEACATTGAKCVNGSCHCDANTEFIQGNACTASTLA
ncbi:hypothetical protein DPMN_165633 [Dreissena polymorpha]|uniref:EB domain-containing protein n=1 Tax=Dreissena polymorpha TaxID=45954 RepID=A0A9D4EV84_DREPO|nr:hypothetical protein DPMN_165633 [Dreissena polymorpha]